jgi:hypothetical protein
MEKVLIDCGTNSGISGDNMRVIEGSERFVYVSGLTGHKYIQLCCVNAQALVSINKGDYIAKFHEMAMLGKDENTLSHVQMEGIDSDTND